MKLIWEIWVNIVVSGTTNTICAANSNNVVIVGQQINLSAQTFGGTFSNYQWTVSGYAISNYDVGNGILYPSFPTTNSSVSFYWANAGTNSGTNLVSCSAACAGITCSTNAIITVVTPAATINPVTTSVVIAGNFLEFGTSADTTSAGIIHYNTLSIPSGFTGSAVWSQIITSDAWNFTDTNGVVHNQVQAAAPPWGDIPTPYQENLSGTPNFTPCDNPGVGLFNNNTYTTVSVDDHFTMTMLFQPSGGIAVPLQAVDWYWKASATNNAGVWTIVSGTATNSVNPTPYPTTTFPRWNCPWGNPTWNPPLL